MPRLFSGCIASKLLSEHSYKNKNIQTKEELYEVTTAKARFWSERSGGKPVYCEHNRIQIGEVQQTYITADNKLKTDFTIDDSTPKGKQICMMLDSGLFHDLSFAHDSDTMEPHHLSLCWKGARENTKIDLHVLPNIKSTLYKENANLLKAQDNLPSLINASTSSIANMQSSAPSPNSYQQNNYQPYMNNDGNTMTTVSGANLNHQPTLQPNVINPNNPYPSFPQQLAQQGVMTPEQQNFLNNMIAQQTQHAQQMQNQFASQNAPSPGQAPQAVPNTTENGEAPKETNPAIQAKAAAVDPMQNAKNGLSKLLTHGIPKKDEAMAVVDLVTAQNKTIADLKLENEKLKTNEGESNSQFKSVIVEFMKKIIGEERLGNNFAKDISKTIDDGDMNDFRRIMVPTLIAASSAVQPYYHQTNNYANSQPNTNQMDLETAAKLELIQKLNIFPSYHHTPQPTYYNPGLHQVPMHNNLLQASSSMSHQNYFQPKRAYQETHSKPSSLLDTNAGWKVSTAGLPDATRMMFEASRNDPIPDKLTRDHFTTQEQRDMTAKRARQTSTRSEGSQYAHLENAPRL